MEAAEEFESNVNGASGASGAGGVVTGPVLIATTSVAFGVGAADGVGAAAGLIHLTKGKGKREKK